MIRKHVDLIAVAALLVVFAASSQVRQCPQMIRDLAAAVSMSRQVPQLNVVASSPLFGAIARLASFQAESASGRAQQEASRQLERAECELIRHQQAMRQAEKRMHENSVRVQRLCL